MDLTPEIIQEAIDRIKNEVNLYPEPYDVISPRMYNALKKTSEKFNLTMKEAYIMMYSETDIYAFYREEYINGR